MTSGGFSVLTQLTFGTTLFCHFCYLFSSRRCEVGTLNLSLDLHGVATWLCGGIIVIRRQKQWRLSNAKGLLCSVFITLILDDLINSHLLLASPRLSWLLMILRNKNRAELIKSMSCLSPHPPKSAYIIFQYQKKQKMSNITVFIIDNTTQNLRTFATATLISNDKIWNLFTAIK